jgi:hypothetical protein
MPRLHHSVRAIAAVGAILDVRYAETDKTLPGVAAFLSDPRANERASRECFTRWSAGRPGGAELRTFRARPGDGCDLGENLPTQAMTNLAERGSLDVREHQSAFQDAVFGGQTFVSSQQLLVHRPCDVGQDARPIHNGLFAPIADPL